MLLSLLLIAENAHTPAASANQQNPLEKDSYRQSSTTSCLDSVYFAAPTQRNIF